MSETPRHSGQVAELRRILRRQGAGIVQIAEVLAHRFAMNPRVAFRHAAGLSQAQVADRYNQRWPGKHPKTYKHISYWECWPGPGSRAPSASARAPSYEDLGRLAGLYGCLVDDLLFGPRQHQHSQGLVSGGNARYLLSVLEPGSYPEDGEDDTPVTLHVLAGEGTITVTLSRRQFNELLAAGGLGAMLPAAASRPGAAGPAADPAQYREILTAHQAGHSLLSPRAHIRALTQQLHNIAQGRHDARPELRRALRRVQSEYAEHVSWLYREAGDIASCRQWAGRAAAWALEAGDTPMAAYMMVRKATLALDQGDPASAAELARAAQNPAWTIPPVLRGVAKTYEARAHALTGTLAEPQLDDATELISTGRSAADPPYLRFFTTGFADVQRATCYIDAGNPAPAVTILQSRITTLPASSRRDRAAYLARLGAAHAASLAPDAAATAGIGSLTGAIQTGSEHILTELQHLDALLTSRWGKQPQVRQFHAALASTQPD